MSAELVAITCLIAYLVIISVVVYRTAKRKESQYLALIPSTVSNLKVEFESMFQDKLQGAIDAIGESLGQLLTEPTVKKAFAIIGKQGGEAKAESGLVDQMANDVLDSPQFAAIRAAASVMGLDIEDYITQHGAIKTIQAVNQLSKALGMDLMKMDLGQLAGSLARPAGSHSSENPYLRS